MIQAIMSMLGGDQQSKRTLREVARILEQENTRLRDENRLCRRLIESLRDVNAALDARLLDIEATTK
jgi:hypothetical protein